MNGGNRHRPEDVAPVMSAEPDFSRLTFLTPLMDVEDAPVCGPDGCLPVPDNTTPEE